MPRSLPKLPSLLDRKIYKTGQTRGADDDEIHQNRVSRSSTVLIPYSVWTRHFTREQASRTFGNGYIVLISPSEYFGRLEKDTRLPRQGLALGQNAVVFYETRAQWIEHSPERLRWRPAESRQNPLGGQYVARIPATTAADSGEKIIRGFATTANKGAGIRVYEYASKSVIGQCRLQLEALFWLCDDSSAVTAANGMTAADAALRKREILRSCEAGGLLDCARLAKARILNSQGRTTCPLCLIELPGQGFFSRMEQAAGREVVDLTITQNNLFHIEELRMGEFNHRPYNLGWGHHHCNVVVRDSGIRETLRWMQEVLQRNINEGHFSAPKNKGS
jgi:hypothetical protein